MKTMKKIGIPLFLLVLAACNASDDKKAPVTGTDSTKKVAEAPKPAPYTVPENLISEHIDGPANIRDKANGKVLFSLEDQTVVYTLDSENGWQQLAVMVDQVPEENSWDIKKGTVLTKDGKTIGKVLEDMKAETIYTVNNAEKTKYGILAGYSAVSNIRKETTAEYVFAKLAADTTQPLTLERLKPFLKTFEFDEFEPLIPECTSAYVIYDGEFLMPTAAPRFWPVFKGNELVAVFYSRKMDIPGMKVTTPALNMIVFTKDEALIKKLKAKHIHFMETAG